MVTWPGTSADLGPAPQAFRAGSGEGLAALQVELGEEEDGKTPKSSWVPAGNQDGPNRADPGEHKCQFDLKKKTNVYLNVLEGGD